MRKVLFGLVFFAILLAASKTEFEEPSYPVGSESFGSTNEEEPISWGTITLNIISTLIGLALIGAFWITLPMWWNPKSESFGYIMAALFAISILIPVGYGFARASSHTKRAMGLFLGGMALMLIGGFGSDYLRQNEFPGYSSVLLLSMLFGGPLALAGAVLVARGPSKRS